jgi:hypothetical protein
MDDKLIDAYVDNVQKYQKIKGGSIPQGFANLNKIFEDDYKENCNCQRKKGQKNWYKICDCYNDKK